MPLKLVDFLPLLFKRILISLIFRPKFFNFAEELHFIFFEGRILKNEGLIFGHSFFLKGNDIPGIVPCDLLILLVALFS